MACLGNPMFAPRPTHAIRRPFTADEFRIMANAGIIDPGQVELREGIPFCKKNGAPRQFNVGEFHALTAIAGILPEDSSTELLDGSIVLAARISPRHAACRSEFIRQLFVLRNEQLVVAPVNPIRLDAFNELIPDAALLYPHADDYRYAHPGPADAAVLIEISDADYDFDRRHKLPIYARYGIAEVWHFNLAENCIATYGQPAVAGYASVQTIVVDGSLTPAAFPDVAIPVSAILPN